MDWTLRATNYTRDDLESLPIDWEARPELRWEEVCSALGFDPRENEVNWGQLRTDWNEHPPGSAVLTGGHAEPGWFTVLERVTNGSGDRRPFKIRRRSLHRHGQLAAYEYAVVDPGTGQIYPASPRARCRPAQGSECHSLFLLQARAWSRGEQVPWSRFLPATA